MATAKLLGLSTNHTKSLQHGDTSGVRDVPHDLQSDDHRNDALRSDGRNRTAYKQGRSTGHRDKGGSGSPDSGDGHGVGGGIGANEPAGLSLLR